MIRDIPWSYPLIMLASVAVAVVLSRRGQSALGLGKCERLGVALRAFCGAMIGAKLPFVLADWEGLASGRAWFENGKQFIKLYLIAYLIYRFLIEFIRPEPVLALSLTGYQWACLGLLPVFVALWAHDAQSPLHPDTSDPSFAAAGRLNRS